ncbi:hypothetical protein [Streptomyces sp. NPDC057257]|uniref:hypothetical protein n=1 Tax=Streptomyces sp. NPDC057257 TaxID=3346071 RepID=UPI0036396D3A
MRTAYLLMRHELRLLASLLMWLTRRTHGIGGGRGFGYAHGQGAVMSGFAFVCVVETVTMSVLLRGYPAVHRVVLVLDAYTVVFIVALHAASVVRPHVLDAGSLRIRRAVTGALSSRVMVVCEPTGRADILVHELHELYEVQALTRARSAPSPPLPDRPG